MPSRNFCRGSMTEKTPAVSLITPVFNTGALLRETAETVRAQTLADWEWILVDDGSEPETLEILEEIAASDPRIYLFKQQNAGAPSARNRGIRESIGAWLKFFDADDLMDPALLERQYAARQKAPDRIIFSETRIMIDLPGQPQRMQPCNELPILPDDLLRSHLEERSGYPGSFLFPRALVEKLGAWDESLKADQDGDYLMRAALIQPQVVVVSGVHFIYRHHEKASRVSQGFTWEKLDSRLRSTEKITRLLEESGRLDPYRQALALRLDMLARVASVDFPDLMQRGLDLAAELCPGYTPKDPWWFNLARRFLGLRPCEQIKRVIRKQ